jgi:H+-translocating NAD(P) transhydrogenase subunit alpha
MAKPSVKTNTKGNIMDLAAFQSILTVQNITVFVLAIFVGYHVVWNVTPALHTPLMAVTNAISGIIIVGALLQTEVINGDEITLTSIIGAVAVFLASINIFGGDV